jgi:hypothetical protein
MKFLCAVALPMYERNSKMYIDILLPDNVSIAIRDIHKRYTDILVKRVFQDPLEGSVLKVKVPFRNRRVSCRVSGVKTVHELVRGDIITVDITNCGTWEVGDYCGIAWKFNLIETPTMDAPRIEM